MKESIGDVKLFNGPLIVSDYVKEDANGWEFGDWAEGFVEVNVGYLLEALSYEASLIASDGAIGMMFDTVCLTTPKNILVGGGGIRSHVP